MSFEFFALQQDLWDSLDPARSICRVNQICRLAAKLFSLLDQFFGRFATLRGQYDEPITHFIYKRQQILKLNRQFRQIFESVASRAKLDEAESFGRIADTVCAVTIGAIESRLLFSCLKMAADFE